MSVFVSENGHCVHFRTQNRTLFLFFEQTWMSLPENFYSESGLLSKPSRINSCIRVVRAIDVRLFYSEFVELVFVSGEIAIFKRSIYRRISLQALFF